MSALRARAARLILKAVDVRDGEWRALLWSFAYFFSLLCAYYVLRPIRDEMGITGDTRALPWLFTGTFVAMLACVPLFGLVVKRYRRSRFIPLVYGFFIANIIGFWAMLEFEIGTVYVARAFFIWTSVFNLFVVSVFWSFMADIFSNPQGKRLFGFIAAGGTAGTIVGPLLTVQFAIVLGTANLMLVSAALLAFAIYCVRRLALLSRPHPDPAHSPDSQGDLPVIGGGILAGITEIARSPYLLGIGLFMLIFTTTSTVLYFEQAEIVKNAFASSAERTRVFAFIDLAVSTLTLVVQAFFAGRIMRRLGVSVALAVLPVVTVAGFGLLAVAPTVALLVGFQIVRRTSDYAVSRPAREVLYTVVTREQKYKAKNVIDTVVYRGGDALSGWIYNGLARGLGLDVASIALLCVPLGLVWAVTAWKLGRAQDKMAAAKPQP